MFVSVFVFPPVRGCQICNGSISHSLRSSSPPHLCLALSASLLFATPPHGGHVSRRNIHACWWRPCPPNTEFLARVIAGDCPPISRRQTSTYSHTPTQMFAQHVRVRGGETQVHMPDMNELYFFSADANFDGRTVPLTKVSTCSYRHR